VVTIVSYYARTIRIVQVPIIESMLLRKGRTDSEVMLKYFSESLGTRLSRHRLIGWRDQCLASAAFRLQTARFKSALALAGKPSGCVNCPGKQSQTKI
jgi:hypothetical protein